MNYAEMPWVDLSELAAVGDDNAWKEIVSRREARINELNGRIYK